jgi:hypothetical protein
MKIRLVLAVLVLATLACGGGQTVIVVTATPSALAKVAPPEVQLPTPAPSRDDLDRYGQIAKDLGLVYDGRDLCPTDIETDGAWYANYSSQYNFCLGVTNGVTTSFGGFVLVDGDTYGFGEDFAAIYLKMGYPNAMLDMIVADLNEIGSGNFSMLGTNKYYGDLVYRISTDEDMATIYIQVLGEPTGPQTPIKLGGNA